MSISHVILVVYSSTVRTRFNFLCIGIISGCRRTRRPSLKSKQVELENIQIHERIMGDDSFNGRITEVSEGYAFVITVIFIFGNRILFSV